MNNEIELAITISVVVVAASMMSYDLFINPNKEKKMDLLKLLQDLVSQLSALQTQLADVPAALEAAKKLSFDEGFAAGVASVPVSDKVLSLAEAEAMVLMAVEPLQIQIAALQGQVDAIPQTVADAISALKKEIAAQIEAVEIDNMALAATLKLG